jgi:aminoglycoside phosphotransferase (APT) family kinase protein
MSDELSQNVCRWVEQAVGRGSAIQSAHLLDGATSSTVYGLVVGQKGQQVKLVLRLFTNKEWLAEEPLLARHEADCLHKALALDVPTPQVVAVDEDGRFCHHPAILMTQLPGQVNLNPSDLYDWLEKLATALVKIHALPAGDFPWPYFSWLNPDNFRVPSWAKSPQLWQEAIEIVSQPEPEEPMIFIHRDYHPTNVLWQGSEISGVVDWVNGCRGPISIDISHCRGNLYKMYGLEAADHFLAAYQARSLASFAYNHYWDVATVMDTLPEPFIYPPWRQFGLPIPSQQVLVVRTERFLANAINKL